MRLSQLFTKTRKDSPADEEARNAQLLIRAGYIHKEMAGVYAYLPLGLKVLENIKQIVREEMNAVGGQELMMTSLQPKDIWEKTDRWDDAKVDNWFKTKLKNGTELGVGLTHEEPIVDVVSNYVNSYKDLPLMVYQIQSKFRNELRAQAGLLRGREFMMKDMYSFTRSQTEHDDIYERVAAAYARIYQRLGLGDVTHRVKADGGIFTDKFSDEFQTITPIGEDTLFRVSGRDEYYNQEIAPALASNVQTNEEEKQMEEIKGEGIVGVKELAKFLGISIDKTTKTMIYEAENGRLIAAAVRGDYEINEIKLRKIAKTTSLKLADDKIIKDITNAEVGYAGLINLPSNVEVFVDESCANRQNFEMGSNKTNVHNINVNWGRDVSIPKSFHDIKVAKKGDLHPESNTTYELVKGVEVGNIFPLESKYTDALSVYFTDEQGQQQSIIAGCYGIGISRVMGVIAELFADDKGLVWPENIAPARVYLIRIGDDEAVVDVADGLYERLQESGIEVLYDDRDERPGAKFADADLLGIPHRVVISAKTLADEKLEYKSRTSSEAELISHSEFLQKLNIN